MDNNIILNRVFTKSTFNQLVNEDKSDFYNHIIDRYLGNITLQNNFEVIKNLYMFMDKEYRNEYYFKNTLINKVLLGRHSLNTTTALTEVPISKSKADFILINNKAIVYEIKTSLDTLERLDTQLSDYYKAFSYVCVLTCEKNYKKVYEILKDTSVGIYVLTNRNTISIRKKPIEDFSYLNYDVIFKILRKNEFENILMDYYGRLPDVTPVFYYEKCFELITNINIKQLYKYMIRELKKRVYIEKENFNKYIPYELKSLIYFSNYRNEDYIKLKKFLEKGVGQ